MSSKASPNGPQFWITKPDTPRYSALPRSALREERVLTFETYTTRGGRASAWDVPGDAHGWAGRRLGLEYARETVAYFRRYPERVGEALLDSIVSEATFHTVCRRAIREGFLAGLAAALTAGYPRPLLDGRCYPLDFIRDTADGRSSAWYLGTRSKAATDPATQAERGRTFARQWVAYVRFDPLAASDNLLDRIVAERAFRDARWAVCRRAFLHEIQCRLAEPPPTAR